MDGMMYGDNFLADGFLEFYSVKFDNFCVSEKLRTPSYRAFQSNLQIIIALYSFCPKVILRKFLQSQAVKLW